MDSPYISYCDAFTGECVLQPTAMTTTTTAPMPVHPCMIAEAVEACPYAYYYTPICDSNDSNYASNTASWTSNALSNFNLSNVAYASNLATFLSNILSNYRPSNWDFASNTAFYASNVAVYASNTAVYASNVAVYASNTAFYASNTAFYASNVAVYASNVAVYTSNALSNLPLLINPTAVAYTPAASNNATDLNRIVIDPNEIKWIVDIKGFATQIGVVQSLGLMVAQDNDQTIPNAVATTLTNWGAAATNTSPAAWNATAGALTVPRAGIYRVEARAVYHAAIWPAGSDNFVTIAINGVGANQSTGCSYATSAINVKMVSSPAQGVFKLEKGDKITVQILQSSGATRTTYGNQCILTVNECAP